MMHDDSRFVGLPGVYFLEGNWYCPDPDNNWEIEIWAEAEERWRPMNATEKSQYGYQSNAILQRQSDGSTNNPSERPGGN